MEVVYSLDEKYKTINKEVLGLYGDITYLDYDLKIHGISYKDNWKVKRLLNGFHFGINNRIKEVFSYLDLEMKYLDYKISELSHTTFKYVMLAYLLIKDIKFIILDHFDAGLTFKAQKKLIGVINKLKDDGYKILVISNNFVFLSKAVSKLSIVYNGEKVFEGTIPELLEEKQYIKNTPIIEFIEEANEHNAKLNYTFDRNDLLEDICRSVAKWDT